MNENRISASLSEADKVEIQEAIATIKSKLPFLIDLTAEESKSLARMGDKSRAFVSKSLELAKQNSDFLPRSFDIDEMQQDLQLFEDLYPIAIALSQLSELISDTTAVAGSEAYGAARTIYNYAKNSGMGSGLDSLVDDLGKRFKARRKPEVVVPKPVI